MSPKRVLPPEAEWLPSLLRRLAEAHGLKAALTFAAEFGGRDLTIPHKATPDHPIARAAGLAVLRWLMKQYQGGEKIDVPIGPVSSYKKRIAMIRRLLAEGADTVTIIRRVGCVSRTIRRHRAALCERADQPGLFD